MIYKKSRSKNNCTSSILQNNVIAISLISIIKWNAAPNVLAWKYPSEGIGIGSQLIGAEYQEDFLIKGGQIVMQYGVGRHTLRTENVPGLNMVFNMVAGGALFRQRSGLSSGLSAWISAGERQMPCCWRTRSIKSSFLSAPSASMA